MAPSSLNENDADTVGWGLFAGKDLPVGQDILIHDDNDNDDDTRYEDILIPILDHYKTIPYRGQMKFPSWLQYIWPYRPDAFRHASNRAFPIIPVNKFPPDGLSSATTTTTTTTTSTHSGNTAAAGRSSRMSFFSPGIASLANSHEEHWNLQFKTTTNDDDDDDDEQQPLTSRFETVKPIVAGSELFLNYGALFHRRLTIRSLSTLSTTTTTVNHTKNDDYETLDDYNEKINFTLLPTEHDKRQMLDTSTMRRKRTYYTRSIAGDKIRLPETYLQPAPTMKEDVVSRNSESDDDKNDEEPISKEHDDDDDDDKTNAIARLPGKRINCAPLHGLAPRASVLPADFG